MFGQLFLHAKHCSHCNICTVKRGKEQNREEGEMTQIKLGGGRNRGKK